MSTHPARAGRNRRAAPGDGFRFGVEEEFFLVRIDSGALVPTTPAALRARWAERFGDRVAGELLQAQVETRTPVCESLVQARSSLAGMRRGLAEEAVDHGLALLCAGTHPAADWRPLAPGGSERHERLFADFGIIARRNAVCGLHVHVEIPAGRDRVALMNRVVPWTPVLLALSASSPFWCGERTGMASYRQCAYDEWPRSGTPPCLDDDAAYEEWLQRLVRAGSLDDGRSVWWTIRPSPRYPTLELRLTDACSDLDDVLAIVAAFRCLVRAAALDDSEPRFDREIVEENRWRAKHRGVDAELLHPLHGEACPLPVIVEDMTRMLGPHAHALDCWAELTHVHAILAGGNGAAQQLAWHDAALADGADAREALRTVVDEIVRVTEAAPVGEVAAVS